MNIQSKLLIGTLSVLFILYAEDFALSQETKSVQKEQQAVKANLLTHEQIISEAQRGVDRSLTILNYTIEAIGVLVGLLTLIILVLGGLAAFFGIKEYRSWKKIRDEFQEKIELQAKSAKTDADKIKDILGKHEAKYKEAEETLSKVKPMVDNIAKIEKDMNDIKGEYESELKNLSITEKPSGGTKEKLDELAKKSEFLEGVGVKLGPEDYFNRGLIYFYKEEYEKSKEAFGKATELKSDHAIAWSNRGAALVYLGENEEAVKSFDKAIELKSDHANAWCGRGAALVNLGENEEAVKSFDKAILLKSDHADAWCGRGVALGHLGENKEAVKSYDKAIELKSDYANTWCGRGAALVNLGENEEAVKSCDKAIELESDHAIAWSNRGSALVNLGENEEALKSFDKATELQPDFARAWHNKACFYSLKGDKEKSLENLRKAIKLDPKHKEGAKKDEDFKSLWDDKDFIKIIE